MKFTIKPQLRKRRLVQDRYRLERQANNYLRPGEVLEIGSDRSRHLAKQWLWFIALWCGGLVSTATLAYAIRWFLFR